MVEQKCFWRYFPEDYDLEDSLIAQEEKLFSAWSLADNIELNHLQALYQHASNQEEIFWKEKVGNKYVLDSDRNTAFFHEIVKASWAKSVTKLKINESWGEDKSVMIM